MDFTSAELAIIEEMVGGRYDSLKEMLTAYPDIQGKSQLLADIKTLEPIVRKLRDVPR